MITKIVNKQLLVLGQSNLAFDFSKLTKVGKQIITDLPKVDIPVRAKYDEQDRFSKKDFYELNNYQRNDRPPRCRYYALEYKNRIYHVFNAYYYPMGRMMTKIATVIRGRNSPLYRNNQADVKNGDICVIVNAADPLFTGKKLLFKNLRYHTGFIGHLRTFSYRHVLNNKPELLYHYLLRKFMPKNKISAKYLQNVKIFRGPTHNLKNLPQFAPDHNIYEYLPRADLQAFVNQSPDIKLLYESNPGQAQKTHGRKFERVFDEQQMKRQQISANQAAEDTSKLHKKDVQIDTRLQFSKKQIDKLRRKEAKYLDRYETVRAPYKKKNIQDPGFLYITDERKARKMPEYKILANQDLEEQDEQVIEDPFGRKAKEAAQKKQKQGKK